MIHRRQIRRKLVDAKVDEAIVERYYQTRAIRRVGEAFEKDRARRALLVMATGSGKTRTVIALVDQLMKANWAKRILFLADRTALVNQAVNAFRRHLPDAAPVNLVTEKNTEGRVYVSTYPTMIGLIDEARGNERRFGVGHFDLIIIDEAHRSIFMKYGAIFEYFDSLVVGLTATPKDEVGRNTYRLFDLEDGVPTDVYSLNEAVSDGFLVPAQTVSVPLKLPTTGIVYDDLSEEEKEQFDLTDWKERADDVLNERRVDAPAINQWLFNADTVDKALQFLMERGQKVEGGDVLGKTIIFAKNHLHAMFIAERFNAHYPQYAGKFARVIDFQVDYAQSIIDDFSTASKFPQIAISVDMLDTGIDVPEVVNLVFFKQVRSKTKFWQMVGRGTRLCPDLFGPGLDKESFTIFDFCGNLEFFSQDLPETGGSTGASLSQKLFATRLELIAALVLPEDGGASVHERSATYGEEPATPEQLREAILLQLQTEVQAMNLDNFIVRTQRRHVEKYQKPDAWLNLGDKELEELENNVAGLPTELEREKVEAKMFDLLILRLQVATFSGAQFVRLRDQLKEIAASLEEASSIPAIRAHLEMIHDLQSHAWWQDVNVLLLEQVRLRLRGLVHLVEARRASPVYADFVDELGDGTEVVLPQFVSSQSFERFKEKARAFLRSKLHEEAIQKLRMNEPLTPADLEDLQRILRESGVGDDASLQQAEQVGIGVFVKSLVGVDREAAKQRLNVIVSGTSLNANQIEFLSMIVDYLTENGVMSDSALFESPFTDVAASGPDGLFPPAVLDEIFGFLSVVRTTASAVST